MSLKTELHCHNIFSNFNVDEGDTPYDCGVTVQEQLEQSFTLGLDVLFVTNHNTLKGYKEICEYKNNHEKYKNIQVYPAEEVSTNVHSHVLVYGISESIKPNISLNEILDEAKKQNAVTIAPHPFSIADSLREEAKHCDLIEIFNSNNVDIFSNIKAKEFAINCNKTGVSGSDSHILSTLGKSLNVIDSENKLDNVISAMRSGKIKILKTDYISTNESIEHIQYKINHSKDYIHDYVNEHYPSYAKFFFSVLNMYEKNPNSFVWVTLHKIAVAGLKRISHKINMKNYDSDILQKRELGTFLKMAFLP